MAEQHSHSKSYFISKVLLYSIEGVMSLQLFFGEGEGELLDGFDQYSQSKKLVYSAG